MGNIIIENGNIFKMGVDQIEGIMKTQGNLIYSFQNRRVSHFTCVGHTVEIYDSLLSIKLLVW